MVGCFLSQHLSSVFPGTWYFIGVVFQKIYPRSQNPDKAPDSGMISEVLQAQRDAG